VKTHCIPEHLRFQDAQRRRVVAAFDAGRVSSDGGLLALRELADGVGLWSRVAGAFTDHRREALIEHTVEELVAQRILGLVCGYEDLNDHDTIRDDMLLALAVGKEDLAGDKRVRERDRGHPLAGKSTLNRMELTPEDATAAARYKKIVCDGDVVDRLLVDLFLDAHREPPKSIVLDADATDDPLHGKQEGRFFHGYYRCYCYLPLYIFCGDFLLAARLRPSNIDASKGTVDELKRIVAQIRQRWPEVEIILRGDSGFARDEILGWCEDNGVEFVVGLAKNERLKTELADELAEAKKLYEDTNEPAKVYKDFRYRTLKTWSRERRVVGKAEHLPGKPNPRFVVTSLPKDRFAARSLYEDLYCARGDMENRIKEQQLGLFADRTSAATIRANQMRLYFSSLAYSLMNLLRHIGLRGTKLERAQCTTIRTRLLKIGALVKLSVRRVHVALSSVFPLQDVFTRMLENIRAVLQPAAP
jgi:hypothetical protein